MVQNVKNLFLMESIISSVEINDGGYTLTFYFLLPFLSELKMSLSSKDKERTLKVLKRIFKSTEFYSSLLNHEIWSFVYKIRGNLGRRQGKHSDCRCVLSCMKINLQLAFLIPFLHREYWLCEFLGKVKALVSQSCLTVCNPMDCSPPASSVHGILQVRIVD